MNITHTELSRKLAERCDYTYKDAGIILNDISEILLNELAKGNSVHIYGLGAFRIVEQKRKTYMHKKARKMVTNTAPMPPKIVFFPSDELKKRFSETVKKGALDDAERK